MDRCLWTNYRIIVSMVGDGGRYAIWVQWCFKIWIVCFIRQTGLCGWHDGSIMSRMDYLIGMTDGLCGLYYRTNMCLARWIGYVVGLTDGLVGWSDWWVMPLILPDYVCNLYESLVMWLIDITGGLCGWCYRCHWYDRLFMSSVWQFGLTVRVCDWHHW